MEFWLKTQNAESRTQIFFRLRVFSYFYIIAIRPDNPEGIIYNASGLRCRFLLESGLALARNLKHVTMKNLLNIVVVLTVAFGWSSCGPYYSYTLNNRDQVAKNVGYIEEQMPFRLATFDAASPGFTKKGQFFIANDANDGFSMSTAYAISDHSYITVSGGQTGRNGDRESGYQLTELQYSVSYGGWGGNNTTEHFDTSGIVRYDKSNKFRSRYFEIGYGRFMKLGKTFSNDWSAGAGYGWAYSAYKLSIHYTIDYEDNTFHPTDYYEHLEKRKFWHVYVQDGIHYLNKNFEASVLGRANSYFFTDRIMETDLSGYSSNYSKMALSLEAVVRLALGGGRFKFFAEYNGALPLLSSEIDWFQHKYRFGVFTRFGGERRE